MNVIKQAAEHLDMVHDSLFQELQSMEAQTVKREREAEHWRDSVKKRKKELDELVGVVSALQIYAERYEGF